MKPRHLLSIFLLTCMLFTLVACNDATDSTDTTAPKVPVCDGAHTWSEWALHSLTLLRTRHCEVCGVYEEHKNEEHVYENERYVAPTCCDPGGFATTCRICGHVGTTIWTRQTDEHAFRLCMESGNVTLYECYVCGIYAREYGRFGEDDAFSYYICENAGVYYMTVTGMGKLPDFSPDNPPPWLDSIYLPYVTCVTLNPGITGVGSYAFSVREDGTNPYAAVIDLAYLNPTAVTSSNADAFSGIRADAISYRYNGVAVRSSEAATYFLRFIVEQYNTEALTFGDLPASMFCFYLYDMTGDGQEELIVHTGSCEADAQYIFYTYQAGAVREADRIGAGHAALYGISDATGVIWHHGSQGYEAAYRLTLSDDGLVRETLFESRPAPSYTVFENAVTLTPYTRLNATNFTGGKG